jgi:hypothetical protein
MAGQALKITRQQLAAFLPDEETIRKFEKLVLLVEQINTTSIDELQTETGIALQKANEAIDRFYNIFGSSIKLDVASFNGILSGADSNLQLAMDTIDDHNHDGRYYTETELDAGQLDNRYYTETEVNAFLLKSVKSTANKTINYTITNSDYAIVADGSSNTVTLTMPASPVTGQEFNISCINSDYAVDIDFNGNYIYDSSENEPLYKGENLKLMFNVTYWVTA